MHDMEPNIAGAASGLILIFAAMLMTCGMIWHGYRLFF